MLAIKRHQLIYFKRLRVTTVSFKTTYNKVLSRSMMQGHSSHVTRAAYYCLTTFTNSDMLNQITPKNHRPLAKRLAALSLDHETGAMQHKTAFLKHMTNHKFPVDDFMVPFVEKIESSIVKWEPNTHSDLRILNELPILKEYHDNYHSDIEWLLCTMDVRPANFPYQKQSNQDFWCMVKTKADRSMGLGYKCVPQDAKSGMDVFRHSSRGTLGLLTYDQDGNNNQITTDPITKETLIDYNLDRLKSLKVVLKTDSIAKHDDLLNDYKKLLAENPENIFGAHKIIQNGLWTDIQRDPSFNRSVSLIFIKQTNYEPLPPEGKAFELRFKFLLGNKLYNLDKTQDCRDIYKAMLVAYKETVDVKIAEKLYHLHGSGITLTPQFIQDIANILKHGIL